MGTNYYLKLKNEIFDNCNPTLKLLQPEIQGLFSYHIGKSSGGVRFLFQGGQEIKGVKIDSFEKWKEAIEDEDFIIYNEYDEQIDKIDFFNLVKRKQQEPRPTSDMLSTYHYMVGEYEFDDVEFY